MPCPQCWQGQAGRRGLAGLQRGLPQQPRVSEQDSDSPSSSGAFCQPGALGSRVQPLLVDKVLVVARTAVVMGGKRPEIFLLQPLFLPICFHGGKGILCSYQIHGVTELQPCEGMTAFAEPLLAAVLHGSNILNTMVCSQKGHE